MRRLTTTGVIVGLAAVAIMISMYVIIRNNPPECRFDWFMCSTPPIAIVAMGVLTLGAITALVGAGLVLTSLVRRFS